MTGVVEVPMPRLSDSMEEGTIVRWLRASGDDVRRGDELVEIETDKATMVYEAEASGVLQILVEEGETVLRGVVIARIGDVGSRLPSEGRAAPTGASANGHHARRNRPFGSPLARRVARDLGIDLSGVTGTGPRGRVVRSDVEAAAARVVPATVQHAQPADTVGVPTIAPSNGNARGETTRVDPTRIQQVAARRMAESKARAPDFVLQADVDMTRAVALRQQIKDMLDGEPAPTYNDMAVKACALALRKHPKVNGSWQDGTYELYSRVNVGVALATDDGLLVPTVVDADARSLGEIARTVRRLAVRGREGKLTPPELAGGTFSVSNLGMYGVRSFTAVLNPPQAAILAVGSLAQRPWVEDGRLVVRWTMALSLTVDHRILNGAEAAEFLMTVVDFLQSPGRLAFT